MKLPSPFPENPPPGPFRPGFWKSPLRGPWLTSILGSILLVGLTIVASTGFLSHAAYEPGLGGNAIVPTDLDIPLIGIGFPNSISWLYAATQGLHVTVGYAVVPLLLAKLWSVMPRLFKWPPTDSPAEGIERALIGLLVASAVFQLATGIANAQNWYPFKFNFVVAHYYGAIIFLASIVLHVAIKIPVMRRAYRERGVLKPLREDLAATRPEPWDHDGLVAKDPDAPTISRRGLLAFAGGSAFLVAIANAGQFLGGPFRSLAFLGPRSTGHGDGPNDFPVNKTFAGAKIPEDGVGDSWRLKLQAGDKVVELSREDLLAMPQRTETLPIACVEGWSAERQWTGVRLQDLAALVGGAGTVTVDSLQPKGVLRKATLGNQHVRQSKSLLALRVNGEDISRDHGFPARVIVPGLPGVHCTKWVSTMTFGRSA